MLLHSFDNGDQLIRTDKAIIGSLKGTRQVLGTSPHLGGFQKNLQSIFNYDCTFECQLQEALETIDYAAYIAMTARKLGLDPACSAGIMTTADMANAALCSRAYHDTSVTAVVTAGIDINGGRAGDPAGWHETEQGFVPAVGTINILLFISASLTDGALARALVTCTEAKAAALQELLAPSRYSCGLATGSGTDGTIIVADAESAVRLSEAGLHCKLGELIGQSVISAVKEALFRQTGLNARRQFSVLARMGRFGIEKGAVTKIAAAEGQPEAVVAAKLAQIDKDTHLVVQTSLFAHLLDQLLWGLVEPDDACPAALSLLCQMGLPPDQLAAPAQGRTGSAEGKSRQAAGLLVEQFRRGLVKRLLQD